MPAPLNLLAVVPPGLEQVLLEEIQTAGFSNATATAGGVAFSGNWPEVWRANRTLRGATRILVRIAEFRAMHLAQLDKRARKVDWASVLRPDVPVRLDVTCRKSRIYHAKAARQRVAKALTETCGIAVDDSAALVLKVRIFDDLCTISVDSSGEGLHKRGLKEFVGKAPLRETLAALILRQAGYSGAEPVLDPMCGSGTFLLEAADMARGLAPGRSRRFAFEDLTTWDAASDGQLPPTQETDVQIFGRDRDSGAVHGARRNAGAAGHGDIIDVQLGPIAELQRPDTAPGLVISNPPYGARIGQRQKLFGLYGAFGQVMKERFTGWRVAFVTSDGGLAKATGLPLKSPGPPIDNGGIKVTLYETDPL